MPCAALWREPHKVALRCGDPYLPTHLPHAPPICLPTYPLTYAPVDVATAHQTVLAMAECNSATLLLL